MLRVVLVGGLLATGPILGQGPFPPPPNHFGGWVPAASVHGVNGTFFQTQITLFNANLTQTRNVSVSYLCSVGPCRGSNPLSVAVLLAPRETRVLENVAASLFAAPESAGSVSVGWDQDLSTFTPDVLVSSRTFTRDTASGGTYGFEAAALNKFFSQHVLFVGVAGDGGDLSSGFRTNVSLQSYSDSSTATLTLFASSGRVLGAPLTFPVGDGVQINDVFKAVGAADVVTSGATLLVDSSGFVQSYVTVIDNRSGDSSLLQPVDDPMVYTDHPSVLSGTVYRNNPFGLVSNVLVTATQYGTAYSVQTGNLGQFEIVGMNNGPIQLTVDSGGACPSVSYAIWHDSTQIDRVNPIICP